MGDIVLQDVTKSYHLGDGTIHALDGLSMEIMSGELAVVLGPSGSGKTTLLNVLGGLEAPTDGVVRIGGIDVAQLSEARLTRFRREKVGFIFQFFNLLPTLTALENVSLAAELAGGGGHAPRELLIRVGLGDRLEHFPGQLSGGQQQRVAVARALAKDPELVLADEPTGSLDVETGVDVLKTMRQLNRETGQTFVIVTHNVVLAQMADRVLRISGGRLVSVETNPAPSEPEGLRW